MSNIFNDLKNIEIESQQEQINSPRYGLSLLVGKTIRCEALLTPNISKAKIDGVEYKLNTVINVHYKGKLVADHIQLNLEKIYGNSNWKLNENATMKIEFKGIVYSYHTGGVEKYSVELTEKPRFRDDIIMIQDVNNYVRDIDFDMYESIFKTWVKCYNPKTKMMICQHMRNTINELTMYEVQKDFIWNYLINVFTLGSMNKYIYEGEDYYLELINHKHLDNLIVILSMLISIFESSQEEFKLYDIFKLIDILCSQAQGLTSFNKQNQTFNSFANYYDELDINGKRARELVRLRVRNFKLKDSDLSLDNFKSFKIPTKQLLSSCLTYYVQQLKENCKR